MPRRGIGRSTSTPGRPGAHQHKRRVNRYGFTKLAEGCETGNLDQVKQWLEKDPEQLEIAEFAGNKPLQIAALAGNIEVVDYLIERGCAIDCANQDKDTPLIDAAENGHLDVVKSLLRAGVDPLRQNLKGRTALDVVKDETDDADSIRALLRQAIEKWNSTGARQKREEEEEQRHRAGPTKELHFMARTYENLLKLVQINDRNGVREFLLARVPVDNGVIAAAAKTGDLYLVNMLMAEMTDKKRLSKAEKPMLSVLGTSHFDMVKALTELDQFNPLWKDRRGRTWREVAEDCNGPMVREEKELLQKLYDEAKRKERQSSSPVSRRDGGKRRPVQDESDEEDDDDDDDESDEDVTPRRVGKRRLMSRRDIRANGRSKSDDESEGGSSSSEGATGPEESKDRPASTKPPGSPVSSRGQRKKSSSAQPSAGEGAGRGNSSALRGADEKALPTVKETVQEKDAVDVKIKAEEKESQAAAEASREEAQRKEDEKAAAAAKRAAEEQAAKEAEKRAAEEREREKLREEQRQREEQERAAEEARREKERKEQEQKALAKRQHQEAVLAGLPAPIAHPLNASSDFSYDSSDAADYIIYHCTPIQVLQQDDGDDSALWVLNAQVAPLLGPVGLELLLQEDQPGFAGSLASSWTTRAVDEASFLGAHGLLTNLHQVPAVTTGDLTFAQMTLHGAEQLRAVAQAYKRLRTRTAVLRYVRWDQVLDHLNPVLRDVEFDVRFDYFQCSRTPSAVASPALVQSPSEDKSKAVATPKTATTPTLTNGTGVDWMQTIVSNSATPRRPLPRRYKGPQRVDAALEPVVIGRTKVTVIHQK